MSPEMQMLVGTWRLVSVEARTADGTVARPYGVEPVGYLTYTAEGRMGVSIMATPAPRVESADVFAGAAEALTKGQAYIGYTGTVGVEDVTRESGAEEDVVSGTVVHGLDTCSYPNWVGTEQRRRFRLEGNRLTLTTPRIERGGAEAVATVVWERMVNRTPHA